MAAPTAFIFLVVLLLPVIGGVMLIVMSRRRGRGYPACGKCGYDVSGTLGTTTARCPECGSEFGVVGIMPAKPQTNKAGLWTGIAMIALPLVCIGGTMMSLFMALGAERQAVRAAVTQQQATAAAAMAAAQQSLQPAASNEIMAKAPEGTPDDVALALTTALTQEQIDVMNESDVREALSRVSKARQFVDDPRVRQRLKREFEAIMQRLRDLPDAPP